MDKLPNEILSIVFQSLPFFQKQECMLVCRRWSNTIRSTSLFSTVHINSADMFGRLTKMLDANPSYRPQIQNLIVYDDFYFTMNVKEVLHYFPCMRFIHNKSLDIISVNTSELNDDLLVNLSNWRNQIKEIEMPWHGHNGNLFSLGVFSSLKKLVISWLHFPTSLSDIISSAPNVNNLVMTEAMISLNDLKSLYTGLKALQCLTLEKVELTAGGTLNGTDTTSSLTTLFIGPQHSSPDVIVRWLQYVTRTCTQLRRFRFIFPWTSNITSQQELNITHNGFVRLLQKLGHQLNYIEINSSDEMPTILNTLRTLKNDKQITIFSKIHSRLKISFENPQLWNQCDFIHQLTINIETVTSKTLSFLRYIKALKKLKIGSLHQHSTKNGSICLNSLLHNCSDSLESLEIYDFDIKIQDTAFRFYSLRVISIYTYSIPKNVYLFISECLPCLKHLTIDQRCKLYDSTIMLKGNNLQSLKISVKHDGFIMIKTLSDNITRYYSLGLYIQSEFQLVESNETLLQYLAKRTTSKRAEDSLRVIRLFCRSIKSLTVNEQIAF